MGNHLHLDYKAGAENPLKYVLHKDDNNPVAVLHPKIKRIGGNGLASDITDDIIFSTGAPLILQAGVDVTGEKDLDQVRVSVSAEGDFFPALSNYWTYEPATTRKKFVNSTRWQAGEIFLFSSTSAIESASGEGVYPKRKDISFDFLKYKWDTRVPSTSAPFGLWPAPLNGLAQYPDGRYWIQMGAMDITGHTVGTGTQKILDNFRPYVESVELKDLQGNVKYRREWTFQDGRLASHAPAIDEPLLPGREYTATILFSELVGFSWAQVGALGPRYDLAGSSPPGLKKTVYTGNILIPPDIQRDELRPLIILGMDTGGNETLKLDPGKREGDGRTGFERRTIDPLHELVRGDDGLMRGTGGEDRFHPLRIDAAPPEISWKDRQGVFANSCVDGAPERCGSEAAPFNINFNTVTFRYTDLGSGLKELKIYKEKLLGEVIGGSGGAPLNGRTYADERELSLPDGKYVQVATDNLGRATTMYFRIDPVTPRLEVSSIAMTADFTAYSVYGVVVDTGSGLDYLRLSRVNTPDVPFSLVSGTTESVKYGFSGLSLGGDGFYVFTAQDMAQNTSLPQPRMQFSRTGTMDLGSGTPNAVVHYVTGVRAQGGPCSILVTLRIPGKSDQCSGRNQSSVPLQTIPLGAKRRSGFIKRISFASVPSTFSA